MKNTVAEKIARNVRQVRKEKGMTQSDLARKLGGHGKEIVERVESGTANVAIAYYYRIAKALGVPISRITVTSNPMLEKLRQQGNELKKEHLSFKSSEENSNFSKPIKPKVPKIKTISALDNPRFGFDDAVNEFIEDCKKIVNLQYQYASDSKGQLFKSVMITYY